MKRIAMIGAGLSGMTCAARLRTAGMEVVVFDKSRGPGGRITTRRRDSGRFDHGAQYFTVHSPDFQRVVEDWVVADIVGEWCGRFAEWKDGVFIPRVPDGKRWVAQPRMSALGRYLADGLTMHLQTRIVELTRQGDTWCLVAENGKVFSGFDAVLLCCPGPQTKALLPSLHPLTTVADSLAYSACWVAMIRYGTSVAIPFDGIRMEHPVFSWAARDSSKPGRDPGERWVLHASPEWSESNLERSPDDALSLLLDAWSEFSSDTPADVSVHRWRYALAEKSEGALSHYDSTSAIGLCGDGYAGARMEDAWRSGLHLAERLLA